MPGFYDNPPFIDGGDYVRAHGYPSDAQMTPPIKVPTAPMSDPLKAGLQFGGLGLGTALAYTGLRTLVTREKPGGWRTARNLAVGGGLGALFGILAARENQKRYGGAPASSYGDVSRQIGSRLMGKAGMEKSAVLPLLALLGTAFTAMGAYGAAKNTGKAVVSGAKGNWRGAGGHALNAVGDALLALPVAGSAVRLARGAKFLRPVVKPLHRGLNAAQRIGNRMYGMKRTVAVPGQVGKYKSVSDGFLKGTGKMVAVGALSGVPYAAGQRLLDAPIDPARAAGPLAAGAAARVAQGPGIGAKLLRMLPEPQAPNFRTMI